MILNLSSAIKDIMETPWQNLNKVFCKLDNSIIFILVILKIVL